MRGRGQPPGDRDGGETAWFVSAQQIQRWSRQARDAAGAKVAPKVRTRRASGASKAATGEIAKFSRARPGDTAGAALWRPGNGAATDTRGPSSQVEACQSTMCACMAGPPS